MFCGLYVLLILFAGGHAEVCAEDQGSGVAPERPKGTHAGQNAAEEFRKWDVVSLYGYSGGGFPPATAPLGLRPAVASAAAPGPSRGPRSGSHGKHTMEVCMWKPQQAVCVILPLLWSAVAKECRWLPSAAGAADMGGLASAICGSAYSWGCGAVARTTSTLADHVSPATSWQWRRSRTGPATQGGAVWPERPATSCQRTGQGQERRDTSIGSQSGIPASSSDCSGACVAQKAKRGKLGVATGEGSARPPPEPARGGRYSHPGERPGPGRRTPEEYGSDACPIPPQGGDRAEPSPNRAPTPTLQSDTGGMGRLFGAAWGSSGEAAERADCDPGAFQYKRGGVDAGRQRVDSGHLPDGCGREARGRGRGPGDGGRRHPRLRGHRGGSTPDQGLGGAPKGGAATPGRNPGCAKASCGEPAEAPARDVSHTATEVRGGTRRCQGAGEYRGTTWGGYYAVQAWAFVQGWSQAARQVPSIGSCTFGLGAAYEPEALAHVWARTANTVRCPGVVAEADFVGPIAGCILGFNLQYRGSMRPVPTC